MRIPEYLSPTSLSLWERDRTEFYLRYLADSRKPREPQTLPMAVGSSFDAWVKCALYGDLFDSDGDGAYDLDALFALQVAAPQRDAAWKAGGYCLNVYKSSGAYGVLLRELEGAVTTPQFEITVRTTLEGGAIVLGKPDLFYTDAAGRRVIYDWKVNGYCSKGNTSPMAGYVWESGRGVPHRGATVVDGVNVADFFEAYSDGWADQLSTYGWLLGGGVGEQIVIGIDQIVGNNKYLGYPPVLRVARHRGFVSSAWQLRLAERYNSVWAAIAAGYVFTELTLADSVARCDCLDGLRYGSDRSSEEVWFDEL